ncbi:MAG: MBL fold metallo-hydrolase [Eubacteriales bacterium]|nr:MBL fold metallo-hydrolase [Eubacteriales bacterium]
MINVERIISFEMDQNCFLVYGDDKKGILIDPGLDTVKILKAVEDKDVDVLYILLTHSHYDHSFSVGELRGHKKLACSSLCSYNLGKQSRNLSAAFGNPFEYEPADLILADGDILEVGEISIKAIETPGHTDGGMCFLIGDMLFSGDTLFRRTVGRCDFPTGNGDVLVNSIKTKLYSLPDDTAVYPGHGENTTIGYEKKFNMFVT